MVNVAMFYIGFMVLPAVTIKSTVFLDVTQYGLADIYQHLYPYDGGSMFLRKL
jgi:hypothetical protein